LAEVALAVLRERSEVVLFLYSMAMGGTGAGGLAGGIALGVGGGVALGFALYSGLLRVPMKHFFAVTNGMLVLLAAGLASTAARFLLQANLLPAWGEQVWDSSWLLANGSLGGRTLGVLIGYDAAPAGIQLVFYGLTLFTLVIGMRWAGRRTAPSAAPSGRASMAVQPQH
jgi:high-affinity iron transporter